MSASWVNKLNLSDSRLHKEDVIRQALSAAKLGSINAQIFLGLLKACYNPYVNFGVKQVKNTENLVNKENPYSEFNDLLISLSGRKLTGNNARDSIQAISMRFDSEEWNTFLAPVLRRDIRAGISEKTINKIVKGTEYEIPIFSCQLAANSEGRPEMKGLKRLEPKLDGVRMLLVVQPIDGKIIINSYSRNGKVFENFTHIEEQVASNCVEMVYKTDLVKSLSQGFVLDGEVVGKTFQELMKQARRKENVQANDSVFYIFDIIPLHNFRSGVFNMPLKNRMGILDSMRGVIDTMENVKLLPYITVDLDTGEGRDQLHRYANDQVNAGFEGIMVKAIDGIYECDRNTNWMKWKPIYDYDLKVVDLEEGTGKHEGRLGALVCEGYDEAKFIRVNVGSGFTDLDRENYWKNKKSVIGQTAVIIADAISQNQDGSYSLRFPRFKTFRDDK